MLSTGYLRPEDAFQHAQLQQLQAGSVRCEWHAMLNKGQHTAGQKSMHQERL